MAHSNDVSLWNGGQRNGKGHLVVLWVNISAQGNDINGVLGNARSGGWWSNKNGEQRACVTCTCLFPKVVGILQSSIYQYILALN
jgi:hypothetical protein